MSYGTIPIILDDKLINRFWKYVNKTDSCWLWLGAVSCGYGSFRVKEKQVRAHRVAYTIIIGELPDMIELHHTCKNKQCVNPEHLEPLSTLDHIKKSETYNKSFCKNGHEFTIENTYYRKGGKGNYRKGRNCRICNTENAWKKRNLIKRIA